jgi:drug/metabolite transporter (DMT)-like permease
MLAVLAAALLHAGWNALAKSAGGSGDGSAGDPLIETTAILVAGAVLSLACLPFLTTPAPESWPYILASGVIHVAYFHLVAAAYRAGDMSLAYPLARGSAPLLTGLASGALLGEHLAPFAIAGIALTCAGVLAMILARRGGGYEARTIAIALANAGIIALYTIVDGIGARASGAPFAYTFAIIAATAFFFLPTILPRHARALATALGTRPLLFTGAGAAIVGSYAVALWAMTRAPIAPVAALREVSILFGVVIARLFLGEHPHRARWLGAGLILAGAAALRLG